MSVFDLPRVHFTGTGVTRLPTGPRSGLLDLATGLPVADGALVPARTPAQEYHDWLDRQGFRYEPDGTRAPGGRFGSVKGWNFGGNSHFWIDAAVTGTELVPGRLDRSDPLVGRALDLWGHYNDHLATTANRARVFDIDPASNWTTAVMVGQLALGRLGRSHDVGYTLIGEVRDVSPPRWHNPRHLPLRQEHPLAREFTRSVVHQFVVDAGERLYWREGAGDSPALAAFRDAVERGACHGLLVQFALYGMAPPLGPDAPDRWGLRGTIAPWRADEPRTFPTGRLLTGRPLRLAGRDTPLHNLALRLDERQVTANAITALPFAHDARGPRADFGDLKLRTASGRLLAVFPRAAYLGDAFEHTGGVLTVPRADARGDDPREALSLCGGDGRELLIEEEVTVHADRSALILEHPDPAAGEEHAQEITVRSFVRGRPARVEHIEARQFFNPRALPLDPRATAPGAAAQDLTIAALGTGTGTGPVRWGATATLATDDAGRARLFLKGAAAGAAHVLLLPPGTPLPCDPAAPGSAREGYDNDDRLGYWSAAGLVSVRVLPDHWHLARIPEDQVTFDLVYREVFAPFELLYSFMKTEILSLADADRVATHARLIWLMCDPRHRDKTFYMPSTRELTAPQAALLAAYMRRTEAARQRPPALPPPTARRPEQAVITTREELCAALRQAAAIELAVMQQYLYALWSIPTHSAGRAYLARGEWTPHQLRLLCGEGPHSLDGGIRGSLLEVAREEMIHFLVINNILMATGEPFHLPALDFTALSGTLPVPLDLCLEGFGRGSLQRFIEVERPHPLAPAVPGTAPPVPGGPVFGSLSEMYAAIREAVQRIDGLFLVQRGRGGGEHHLFMRETLNVTHPDYQLEVDDVSSAVFAIDFVTEQGEGNVIDAPLPSESHFDTFLRVAEDLAAQYVTGPSGRRVPWEPAYPVLRNPTLRPGNGAGELITDERARAAVELFDRSYTLTMQLMAQHFGLGPDHSLRRSRLMNAALDLMTGVLRPLAEHIVTLPSGRPGRTAGPTFGPGRETPVVPRADVALRGLAARCAGLARDAERIPGLTATVPGVLRFFADQFTSMDPREL